jgi:hypothetical protein
MGFFGGGTGGGTTYSDFVGASTGTAGTSGLVPAPVAGKNTRYLSSDATFGELPLLPKYKNTAATRYILPVVDGYVAGSATPTVNVRYFHLLYSPTDGQVDVFGLRTGTGATAAYNINLAIWNCLEDGTVGSYVIGGNVSSGTATSTNLTVSVTPTNIVRGYYWMSLTAAATPSGNLATTQTSGNCYLSRFLGSLSPQPSQQIIWNYTCLTSYDQTTHETFNLSSPTGLQVNTPNMGFQWV